MPRFSLRSVWNNQQYATLFTSSCSFNSWTKEIWYAWSLAFFAECWQVLLDNPDSCESWHSDFLGDASSRSFTFWIVSSDIFGRPVCSSNKPLGFQFLWQGPNAGLARQMLASKLLQELLLTWLYQFCFPISANNKHLLLQSIPIHFPAILCEFTHTLTLTNNNRIVQAPSAKWLRDQQKGASGRKQAGWWTAAPCCNN